MLCVRNGTRKSSALQRFYIFVHVWIHVAINQRASSMVVFDCYLRMDANERECKCTDHDARPQNSWIDL